VAAAGVQIESTGPSSSGREQTLQFRFEIVQREPARTSRSGRGRALDLYSQALAALESGDLPGARASLQRWIGANPEHTVAHITLGNLLLRAHDLDGALAAYERARERDPLLPEIHYLQGVVYRKLGDLTRAIHSFRHALFLDPRFWSAAFMLAGAQGRAGNPELQQRDLRRALELLEAGGASSAFTSYVEGMKDVCISPEEALRHCRRELGLAR
jgi:tetratricopeptide (TPR) repeat protein